MSIASDKPQLSGYGQPTWDVARLFPAQGCWTEEDYLELKPNRWVEFSHGFVEFLATPTLTHQLVALYLYRTLESFVSTNSSARRSPGPIECGSGKASIASPTSCSSAAKHASRLTENYCKGADLVMEVVSDGEENHRLDRETKRDEYAKARIPEYWIVDPEQARITVLDPRRPVVPSPRRILREGDQAISKLLPGFRGRCDLGRDGQAMTVLTTPEGGSPGRIGGRVLLGARAAALVRRRRSGRSDRSHRQREAVRQPLGQTKVGCEPQRLLRGLEGLGRFVVGLERQSQVVVDVGSAG